MGTWDPRIRSPFFPSPLPYDTSRSTASGERYRPAEVHILLGVRSPVGPHRRRDPGALHHVRRRPSSRRCAGRRHHRSYGGGVRRAELVQLGLSDYTIETGATRVRSGKGNKERITYVQGMGCTAVEAWLQVRGPEPGPLIVPIHRSGKIQLRHMREQSVYDMPQRRAREAGVRPFSPHDLRRTFAGDLLDAGADISTVLMGHASVNTTQGYDRSGGATKRKAASLLHISFNLKSRTSALLEMRRPEVWRLRARHDESLAQWDRVLHFHA